MKVTSSAIYLFHTLISVTGNGHVKYMASRLYVGQYRLIQELRGCIGAAGGDKTTVIKKTTRGLSGVCLLLVMNPLCPLRYYDRSITCPWSLLGGTLPYVSMV